MIEHAVASHSISEVPQPWQPSPRSFASVQPTTAASMTLDEFLEAEVEEGYRYELAEECSR